MKAMISAMAAVAALSLSAAAFAQGVPSGGPDAKGNAPLKHPHTVNDGAAKPGATSFTEAEARKHIQHAGYLSTTSLTKGTDGVWRGKAMKGDTSVNVGLDFKGNVTEGGAAASSPATVTSGGEKPMATAGAMSTTTTKVAKRSSHWRHRHAGCANAGPNGTACSGIDRNKNGISDKEDHAIKAGAKP